MTSSALLVLADDRLPPKPGGSALPDPQTEAFYRIHARDYALASQGIDVGPARDQFIHRVGGRRRVLDAGCGSGRDLAAFRQGGLAAEGLEQSPELAALARSFSSCPVVVGDLRQTAYPDQHFDGVWTAASLLHLPREELGGALRELRRILKSGGLLFASVKLGSGAARGKDGRWFTYYQPSRWQAALAGAGFRDIEIEMEQDRWAGKPRRRPWIQSFATA